MAAIFVAVGIAIVVATFAATAANYGSLPERVAIHFGFDGTANGYGPRPAVWLLPAIQCMISAQFAFLFLGIGRPGLLAFGDAMLFIVWRAQLLILSAATARQERVPIGGFWIAFVAAMAAGVVSFYVL